MVNSWLVAQARLTAVYVIGIISAGCYLTLNIVLAASGDQQGLYFLAIPSAWGIITSIIGLRRLRAAQGQSSAGTGALHGLPAEDHAQR
jgi:hypothetical protein